MAKKLLVTKDDGTNHVVETSIRTQLEHQNNLRPANRRWTFKEIDESEVPNIKYKQENFVPASAAKVVAAKDAEIAQLKAQLEKLQTAGDSTVENPETKTNLSLNGSVKDAVAHIAALSTVADVEAYIAGETRTTVVKAANEKVAELSK